MAPTGADARFDEMALRLSLHLMNNKSAYPAPYFNKAGFAYTSENKDELNQQFLKRHPEFVKNGRGAFIKTVRTPPLCVFVFYLCKPACVCVFYLCKPFFQLSHPPTDTAFNSAADWSFAVRSVRERRPPSGSIRGVPR